MGITRGFRSEGPHRVEPDGGTLIAGARAMSSFKKPGLIAILFFTAKGLLWLLAPLLISMWGC